jgi:hypothetical protein
MTDNWYASVSGQNYGPYNLQNLRNMFECGELRPDTMVYHQTIGNWRPANQLSHFADVLPSSNYQPAANNYQPASPYGTPVHHKEYHHIMLSRRRNTAVSRAV